MNRMCADGECAKPGCTSCHGGGDDRGLEAANCKAAMAARNDFRSAIQDAVRFLTAVDQLAAEGVDGSTSLSDGIMRELARRRADAAAVATSLQLPVPEPGSHLAIAVERVNLLESRTIELLAKAEACSAASEDWMHKFLAASERVSILEHELEMVRAEGDKAVSLALCGVLDRLGADGTVPAIAISSPDPKKQPPSADDLEADIYRHVRDLELGATVASARKVRSRIAADLLAANRHEEDMERRSAACRRTCLEHGPLCEACTWFARREQS